MGWAEDQARAIADAEAKRKTEQEWQILAAAKAKMEAPDLFEKLGAQIEAYVAEFNAARSSSEVRCSRALGLIEIVKEAPRPSMYVRVSLFDQRPSVEVLKRSVGVEAVLWSPGGPSDSLSIETAMSAWVEDRTSWA